MYAAHYLLKFEGKAWSRDPHRFADLVLQGAPPLPRPCDKEPPGHWEIRRTRVYVPHPDVAPVAQGSRRQPSVSSGAASAGVSPSRQARDSRSSSRCRSRSPARGRAVLRSRAASVASGSATGAGGAPQSSVGGTGGRSGRGPNWRRNRDAKRFERSKRHHEAVHAGTHVRLPSFDPNLGPVRIGNDCKQCYGYRQFSFLCQSTRQMCGSCCRAQPGGGCPYHNK